MTKYSHARLPTRAPSERGSLPIDDPGTVDPVTSTEREVSGPEYWIENVRTEVDADQRGSDSKQYSPVAAERVYPHLFGVHETGGRGLALVIDATGDVDLALASFEGADLEEAMSRLVAVAASMKMAQEHLKFSRPLHSLIAHVRRAILRATVDSLTFAGLNCLASTLRRASQDPLLGLNEVADLISDLEGQGWNGELQLVDDIVDLISSLETGRDAGEGQANLFSGWASIEGQR